jgi:Flp pilus assembly protein CpaB
VTASTQRLFTPAPLLASTRVRARRFLQRYRRAIAAGLLVLAAVSALRPLAAAEAGGVTVPVLSRSLPAGDVVRDRDLTTVTLPAAVLPDDALIDSTLVVGQRLSVGASAGEILTPTRLLIGSVAADQVDIVAPVRIADPQIAALLRVGDVVDVLAASSSSSTQARVVASAARVVGSPSASASSGESTGSRLFGSASSAFDNGGLVLLAVDPETASALAGAAVSSRLSITVRPQP